MLFRYCYDGTVLLTRNLPLWCLVELFVTGGAELRPYSNRCVELHVALSSRYMELNADTWLSYPFLNLD